MRNHPFRALALLLCLSLLLPVLFACGVGEASPDTSAGADTTTGGGTTGGDTTTGGTSVENELYFEGYSIVIPFKNVGESVSAAAIALWEATGAEIKNDFVLPGEEIPADEKEILIGNTNRPVSSEASATLVRMADWYIGVEGQKLVVVGKSDEATAAAVNWLLDNALQDGVLRLTADFHMTYSATYAVKDFTVCGADLRDYAVVYEQGDEYSKAVATDIAVLLSELWGYLLPVRTVSSLSLAGDKALTVEKDREDSYRASVAASAGGALQVRYGTAAADLVDDLFRGLINEGSILLEEEDFTVKKKETYRIVLLGDSNTANGYYTLWLNTYFQTRYPDKAIELIPAGRPGGTESGGYARLDWSVLNFEPDCVAVCFGCNSFLYLYNPGRTDTERQNAFNGFMTNSENIFRKLKEKGIEVISVTPVMYDEGDYTATACEGEGRAHEGFYARAEALKELSKTLGILCVDNYNTQWSYTEAVRAQTESDGEVLFVGDRKHMNPKGGLVMAYSFFRDLDLSKTVAAVEIDTASASVTAENATAQLLSASATGVKYTYLAKALPLPVAAEYTALKTEGILDPGDYSRETVKVTGLSEGTYDILIDNVSIGSYTSSELAAGVNIAELQKNPAQVAAAEAMVYLEKNRKLNSTYFSRKLDADTLYLYPAGKYGKDRDTTAAYVESWLTQNSSQQGNFHYISMERYMDIYDNMDKYTEEWHYNNYMASKCATPEVHTVEIRRQG